MRLLALAAVCLTFAPVVAANETDEARTLLLEGKRRTYFLFAPDRACEPGAAPAALVVLHHGTGGSGRELVDAWRGLARKDRIILVAPTGTGRYGWIAPQDGPELQRVIVDQVRAQCAVDRARIYAVGFSNGGDLAFYIAVAESRYFAGAAILCASLRPRQFAMLDLAPRKIPLFYMVAANDAAYPYAEATATRDALERRKWPLRYRVLPGGHRYDPGFTEEAWQFLRQQKLDTEPEFAPLNEQWLRFALR